jgi:hypothetical protein
VHSVPITTEVVSSNHVHGEVYSIHYMMKLVSDLRQVGGFLRFLPDARLIVDAFDVPIWYVMVYIYIVGFWCLTLLSTIFQLHGDSQCYWRKKPQKPTDLSQVTHQLHHIMYRVHTLHRVTSFGDEIDFTVGTILKTI